MTLEPVLKNIPWHCDDEPIHNPKSTRSYIIETPGHTHMHDLSIIPHALNQTTINANHNRNGSQPANIHNYRILDSSQSLQHTYQCSGLFFPGSIAQEDWGVGLVSLLAVL